MPTIKPGEMARKIKSLQEGQHFFVPSPLRDYVKSTAKRIGVKIYTQDFKDGSVRIERGRDYKIKNKTNFVNMIENLDIGSVVVIDKNEIDSAEKVARKFGYEVKTWRVTGLGARVRRTA